MMTDFLALDDHQASELTPILERAIELEKLWRAGRLPQTLGSVRVALIVDDGGWRNTTAFELGVETMGGVCIKAPITLQGNEAVSDLGRYLDNWFDIIVVRTPNLSQLRELAAAAAAPVVNARTRGNHPCETLGDLAFVLSRRRSLDRLRVAVIAPDDNILGSWAEAAAVWPINVIQIFPERWHAKHFDHVERFSATEDIAALEAADVVITDCWPKNAEVDEVLPYQVTPTMLNRYTPHASFIPCPPVTRGQEVSLAAMDVPNCQVAEAKAFLLHAQNALLEGIASAMRRNDS